MPDESEARWERIERHMEFVAGNLAKHDAQIAGLIESAAKHDEEIASLRESVAGLERSVARHDEQIASLAETVATLAGSVAGLERSVGGLFTTTEGLQGIMRGLIDHGAEADARTARLERSVVELADAVRRHIERGER
jgi:chromosome segregation ATPase